ncbi:hypothetical protein C8P64_0220 [Christiangramia gaetbulicola]|uniref:Uncharacterized protein n=1 Tax=Christiangramia gaetbulicola TaxID=703340 RepID=A0A2T6AKD8_9FLAO|nr:hypothetical protein C8P64_0220 [Christiangramia gaetbulicola]
MIQDYNNIYRNIILALSVVLAVFIVFKYLT